MFNLRSMFQSALIFITYAYTVLGTILAILDLD